MADSCSPAVIKFTSVLRGIAERNGFENYEIKYANASAIADGYTSTIDHAQILSDNKELNLLVKSCGPHEKVRDVMPIADFYNREKYMYETIFPMLEKFEISHNKVPMKFAPTYYEGYINKDNGDVIVLENMNSSGYAIHNRKELFDYNHVKLVLKLYAQFHATSFAYRYQHPTHFDITANKPMPDLATVTMEMGGFLEMYAKKLRTFGRSLDSLLLTEVKVIYENFISDLDKLPLELTTMTDEYSTILHGDCWKNNILFRYGDSQNPSIPTDALLIDFQLSKVASPMLDVASFFYAGSSKEVIDHMQEHLDYYYTMLSEYLQGFGCDPEKIYPRSVMADHWKKFAKYGLIIRSSIVPIVFSEEKERKRITEVLEGDGTIATLFDYSVSNAEKFEELNRHAIIHFVSNHLI